MKKLTVLFLLFSLTISAQKIDRKTFYDYSDAVEFRIFGVSKTRSIDIGSGNYSEIVIAKKGKRFVTIIFEFKNKSSEEQIIDFENMFLMDNKNEAHKVYRYKVTGIRSTSKSFQQRIKPNKKFKVIVTFDPPIDKKRTIKTLILDDKEIELKFKK